MGSWSKAVEWYESTVKWKDVVKAKFEKLEEADSVWKSIKEEFGEANSAILVPLLNQDPTDS
jgi:hypothetical protein